jgi:hypothetical protein
MIFVGVFTCLSFFIVLLQIFLPNFVKRSEKFGFFSVVDLATAQV